jgi:hypothetical protein
MSLLINTARYSNLIVWGQAGLPFHHVSARLKPCAHHRSQGTLCCSDRSLRLDTSAARPKQRLRRSVRERHSLRSGIILGSTTHLLYAHTSPHVHTHQQHRCDLIPSPLPLAVHTNLPHQLRCQHSTTPHNAHRTELLPEIQSPLPRNPSLVHFRRRLSRARHPHKIRKSWRPGWLLLRSRKLSTKHPTPCIHPTNPTHHSASSASPP